MKAWDLGVGLKAQRVQYPLIKEYIALNYGGGVNINYELRVYSLIQGYWALWKV